MRKLFVSIILMTSVTSLAEDCDIFTLSESAMVKFAQDQGASQLKETYGLGCDEKKCFRDFIVTIGPKEWIGRVDVNPETCKVVTIDKYQTFHNVPLQ